ncbi:Craniofacial development protein 1 [Taenia crassiceps]|uniref:Craniofacial development protein 1 n=1 Tax=Taenia crassiceps TaxID=6207 RepID=A0ABR4QB93_9CEST
MGDSIKSESESSDDEEYIPPAFEEESSEDSGDEVSDDEVRKGANVKKGTKLLGEKDRDDIWTDFLKETKPLKQSNARLVNPKNSKRTLTPLPVFLPKLLPIVLSPILTTQRPAPSTGNRLTDALKRLKSSTLSSSVPKISVLEKSRLDWESFTEKEGIKDDLKLHNRGKNGHPFPKSVERIQVWYMAQPPVTTLLVTGAVLINPFLRPCLKIDGYTRTKLLRAVFPCPTSNASPRGKRDWHFSIPLSKYVERKAFEARTQEREYQILKEARLKSIQRR